LAALAQVLDSFAHGEGATVLPAQAELTTRQAADALRVSRPFLIGLLGAGHIEYRTVGAHRRVKAASLIRVGLARLVALKWTDQILDDVVRNLRANRLDLDPARLDGTRRLMNDAIRDVTVTGIPAAAIVRAWSEDGEPGDVLDSLAVDAPDTAALVRQTLEDRG
jgi:excisionase family DNA binding protein